MPRIQSKFQNLIKPIGNNVNAYTKIVEKAPFACIVLHQHLGLVENIVQTSEYLLGNKISFMIPDLFLSVTSKTLLNNEFDALKKLKFSRVLDTVQTCLKQLHKNHSKIIMIGFSIGSAYGFKILQKMPETFQAAFLFYGTPSLNKWNCNQIKTKVISFYGTDDKIKYLSDYSTYQEFINRCKSNQNIKFQQIGGAGHGFCNPDSPNFSEQALKKCHDILTSYLYQTAGKKDGKSGESGQKSDCNLF